MEAVLKNGKTLTVDEGLIKLKSGNVSVWLNRDDVLGIVNFWADNIDKIDKEKYETTL